MWAQVISAAVGLWVMMAPGVLGYGNPAANNDHIVGPVIVTFAVVAWWEATRGTRRWNWALGAWLLLAPWVLGYSSTAAIVSDMSSGVLVLIFSSIRGRTRHRFGGGWSALWQSKDKTERDRPIRDVK